MSERFAPMNDLQIADATLTVANMAKFHRNATEVHACERFLFGNRLLSDPRNARVTDVHNIQEFVLAAAPPNTKNYMRHGHMQLAGKVAREVAVRLGLNRNLADAAARLHDFGALVTNRHVIHEDIGDVALGKVFHIHPDVLAIIQAEDLFDGINPDDELAIHARIEQVSDYQRVMILADIAGKRIYEKDGRMGGVGKYSDIVDYHNQKTADLAEFMKKKYDSSFELIWTRERVIPDDMRTIGKVYQFLYDRALRRGVDMEDVRETVLAAEARAPVSVVLLDAGGVLIPNPDASIAAALDPVAADRYRELIGLVNEGKMPESELRLNKRQLLIGLNNRIDPKMRKLRDSLLKAGFRIGIASNTIPTHEEFLRRGGVFDGADAVDASWRVGVRKPDLLYYTITAIHHYKVPRECVFIDDKLENVEAAEQAGMKAIHHHTPADTVAQLRELGLQF